LCPPGRFTDEAGQQICKGTDCQAGKYGIGGRTSEESSTCKDCPEGKFQDENGQSKCKIASACPAGKYHIYIGSEDDECNDCPAGKYKTLQDPVNHRRCLGKNCDPGTFGVLRATDSKSAECKQCPTGQYQDQHTKTNCKNMDCGPGKYASLLGTGNTQNPCEECPPGKYKPGISSAQCQGKLCPTGKYGIYMSSNKDSATCNACLEGKYQDEQGQAECKDCTPGMFSDVNRIDCQKCFPGQYGMATGTGCQICPMWTYQDEQGKNQCKRCEDGKQPLDPPGATNCTVPTVDLNYFPGFAKTQLGDGFAAGIGPRLYSQLKSGVCLNANTVRLTELHDGAQAGVILHSSALSNIELKQCCSDDVGVCKNGVIDQDTCQCACYRGFTGSRCERCVDPNADPFDQCESCNGNFRKNTLGKCTLCKFGYGNPENGCNDCAANLDPALDCQHALCKNIQIANQPSFFNTIFARSLNGSAQLVDGMYMAPESFAPEALKNTYVNLKDTEILYFITENHQRHRVKSATKNIAALEPPHWWIWTLDYAETADESKSRDANLKPPSLPSATAVEEKYLNTVVCTHENEVQKFVLSPYAKHAYEGSESCTKIDTALVQRLPLANPYSIHVPRSSNIPHIFSDVISAGASEKKCAEACKKNGGVAWTFLSGACKCSESLPTLEPTPAKGMVAGGLVLPNDGTPAINKISLFGKVKQSTQFAETAAVCCNQCAKRAHTFYLRDGFNCDCYDVSNSDLSGTELCNNETIMDTTNLFFGQRKKDLESGKTCDRKQGCVQHQSTCVKTETIEQSDELQFGQTSVCDGTQTERLKVYTQQIDSRAKAFGAKNTPLCGSLHWQHAEPNTFFPSGTQAGLLATKVAGHVLIDDDKNEVYLRTASQTTVTAMQLTQKVDIESCVADAGYNAAIAVWEKNVNVYSPECLGRNNCPAQAKSIANQLLKLKQTKTDAQNRCFLQETMLNDEKAMLLIKQCGPGLQPPDCTAVVTPTQPTPPPRLQTEFPTPSPALPPQTILNEQGCVYQNTSKTFVGAIKLELVFTKANLTNALDECTFNLVCSHVEETNNFYRAFAHRDFSGFVPDARPAPTGPISTNTTTYFKIKPCFLT
tara:strand:+ start:339 stop:3671 length:3333 start_codon:yes stop_codon:yes gene_type:complete